MTFDPSKLVRPDAKSSFRTRYEDNLDAALYYAEQGWRIFPVRPEDKRPATKHGFQDATTDPDQIVDWWEKNLDYGIGCAAGAESGFFVLDLDLKHDGPQKWYDLLRQFNGSVELVTRQSKTGSGGLHHFFRYHEGITNSSGSLPLGMDIRGEGGYVILPPSGHPSGSRYEWVQSMSVQPAPPWLLKLILTKPKVSEYDGVVDFDEDGFITNIPDGYIDNYLTHLAGTMRHYGFSEPAMFAALAEMLDCVEPGHTHTETDIQRIAHSIASNQPDPDVVRAIHELAYEEVEDEEFQEFVKEHMEDDLEPDESGLIWRTAEETWQTDFPDPHFLAWPLFCESMTTLITGKWKVAGKTMLVLSAILFGRSVTPGPVVYLYEGSERELKTYLKDAHFDDSQWDNLHVLYRSLNTTVRWSDTIKAAVKKADAVGSRYIVIDTRDEWLELEGKRANDAGDVRAILREIMVAKNMGIGVAIVCHTTKNQNQPLEDMVAGSGQWAATADWLVGLWPTETGSTQRLIEAYGRMGIDNNIPKSVIELDTRMGEYHWLGEYDEDDSHKVSPVNLELAEMMEPNRGYTVTELAELAEVKDNTMTQRLRRSIRSEEGLFEKHPVDGLYYLTDLTLA